MTNQYVCLESTFALCMLITYIFLYKEDPESYKDIDVYSVALLNTVAPGPFE